MYSFSDFIRSCTSYAQFQEWAPIVRQRLLVDPLASCLLALMLSNENTESLLEDDQVLFEESSRVIRVSTNPYVNFGPEVIRSCTREQSLALYFSLQMIDYPVTQMTALMQGSAVVFPRVFVFVDEMPDQRSASVALDTDVDEMPALAAFPAAWREQTGAVFSLIPNTYKDKYYSIFRTANQIANVYYYKSTSEVIDVMSSFVRVVSAEEFTPNEFMRFVEKTISTDVRGIVTAQAGKLIEAFPGWYHMETTTGADLSLLDVENSSAVVALNTPEIDIDQYLRYDADAAFHGTTALVFASNWKVRVQGDINTEEKRKLKRFFAGRVLPKANSSYGFFVYECVINNGRMTDIRDGLTIDPTWVRANLLDIIPEVKFVSLAYSPSNKAYEQFIELTSDKRVMSYIAQGEVWPREKTIELITQAQQDTVLDLRDYYHWFLLDEENNLLCYIALSWRVKLDTYEVRIISRVPLKGYARRAVIFASNFFRAVVGARRALSARVNARNEASVRLFDSLYPSWERKRNAFGVIHYKLR